MTVEAEIRRRVEQRGAITFAEFIELALFWPQGGYYLGSDPIGPSGDYYTSPLAHPAFGALLALQLFQMWQLLGCPGDFTVVETGAGNGLLCRDVVTYSSNLPPSFRRSLRYLCLERRPAQGVEKELGSTQRTPIVARVVATGLPLQPFQGCVLSNEFLDSFPVHQVTLRQGRLQEVYVTLQGQELIETLGDPSTPDLAARLEVLRVELAEGQTAEINLGLDAWAEQAAAALEAGFVLTIDYGQVAPALYSRERRPRGTLTTFYRQTQTDDPLRHVGRQDITTQVDFTSVIDAGSRAGLELLGFIPQGRFLHNLGLGRFLRRLAGLSLPATELEKNRAGMLDLVRPGGLGGFKVLAQGKGVGRPALWGFEPAVEPVPSQAGGACPDPDFSRDERAYELAERLPVPLLTPQHLSVMLGRYPHAGFDYQGLWPTELDSQI